jgi:hypothetical protein
MNVLLSNPIVLVLVIALIFTLTTLIYNKRKWLNTQLRRIRLKEVAIGPAKFEPISKSDDKSGVKFGTQNDFTEAQVEDIVAGNRSYNASTDTASSSVDFGSTNIFKGASIKKVTGGTDNSEVKTD